MAGLRDVIDGLARRSGVAAVVLVSADGLVIDQAMTDAGDPDEVAALSATLVQHAAQLGSAGGRGAFQAGVLEYGRGMIVLSQAGDGTFMVLLVEADHNVGALLFDLRRHEPAIAALL
jgi:predicted regulator of Ras-like GTPase activity (Roadblock/LC7/MglB family)